MIYTGKLISADFEKDTLEFEITEPIIARAGEYVILSKDEYEKLAVVIRGCPPPKEG